MSQRESSPITLHTDQPKTPTPGITIKNTTGCIIFSYILWILFIVAGCVSLYFLSKGPEEESLIVYTGWKIWTIWVYRNNGPFKNADSYPYFPFQMHVSMVYIVFILSLIIVTAAFVVYLIETLCKKNEEVIDGIVWHHYYLLICGLVLFIIGIIPEVKIEKQLDYIDFIDRWKGKVISGIVFAFIGIGNGLYVYIKTKINHKDWWIPYLIKKGYFSCLLLLFWYYVCYDIYYIRFWTKYMDPDIDSDEKDEIKWIKGCGLAFSIIFGVGSLSFAFTLKDLTICVMNALIYIGLAAFYFKIDKDERKSLDCNKNGDGIVDIIMIVLSVALFVILFIKYRDNCLS